MDDEAVSPVIGGLILFALTVVLAAVVFVLVSNLGKGHPDTWCGKPNEAYQTKSFRDANVTMHPGTSDEYVIVVRQAKWECREPGGSVAYSTWIDVGKTEPRRQDMQTPGFELVVLVTALACALSVVRRKL